MIRRTVLALLLASLLSAVSSATAEAQQPQAFGRVWGGAYGVRDWERFYHYPYVFYPHNYWGSEYYRSAPDMYHRYPQEMRIPVYNKHWHNFYPAGRRYHSGHHFVLDVL